MQVVLLEDVKTLGKKGEIVEINDGYARNFILPKKLGIEANKHNLNDLKLRKEHERKVALEKKEEAQDLANRLQGKTIKIPVKIGADQRIFGSVSAKEIAKEVQEQLGLEIDKKKIHLEHTIKDLGKHQISVKLHREVNAELDVEVVGG
ncbi:50S ribosomal protein L9 [Clostridia bacterium]|nr:50S ribosomal protein L9 [Clostridia bacterium]